VASCMCIYDARVPTTVKSHVKDVLLLSRMQQRCHLADLLQDVAAANDGVTAAFQKSFVCVSGVCKRVGLSVFCQRILHRNALLKELKHLRHTHTGTHACSADTYVTHTQTQDRHVRSARSADDTLTTHSEIYSTQRQQLLVHSIYKQTPMLTHVITSDSCLVLDYVHVINFHIIIIIIIIYNLRVLIIIIGLFPVNKVTTTIGETGYSRDKFI